ncbi:MULTISPECIES: DUF397 domain-containing protein [Streptomyces]|uniref:Xanthine/CO dehydrogenase XdhC/CoxF family maturation factor n=1 Tax=Streptomyces clavifer TaxID=68188 RepID=A0ABS4VJW5_9ACTN|nr:MULTISPECIES: DUF397 domain-containing protein [Streptomyces]MBP2364222.1 xanthine/CO dehydrogenase XdhC/CoxF family maturation factor [Streptomyces clavifer]MDX2744357.1 DUF397 domain-containing protein [Streptomyces sp. NRRL_B-2557]GHB11327.1 hypothetical protein GCM10010392_43790 [Streptomyces clavifer]
MSVDTRTEQQPSELVWFKSSYSGTNGGDCVEVAATPAAVHVRDSKRPRAASLTFSAEQWGAFAAYAGQA